MASSFKKMIMMPNPKRTPLGFEDLKYIESDGSQWINTLIAPENGCWVIVDNQKTNYNPNAFLLGASSNGYNNMFNINDTTEEPVNGFYHLRTYFRYGENNGNLIWKFIEALPFPRKTLFMDSKGFRVTNNNIYTEGSFTKSNDISNKTSIALFALLRTDGSINELTFPGRIYEYIYGVNAEERMHLIPALRKADSKPGMYDLVSGQFFVNKGTGEFTYG